MWGCIQPASGNSVHHQEEFGQSRSGSLKPESSQSSSGSTMAVSGGNTPGAGHLDSTKPAQAAPHSVSSTYKLESTKGLAKIGSSCHPCKKESASMEVNPIKSDTGSSIGTSPFHPLCLQGRIHQGLESLSGQRHVQRDVDSREVSPPHKLSQDEGCQTNPLSLSDTSAQ